MSIHRDRGKVATLSARRACTIYVSIGFSFFLLRASTAWGLSNIQRFDQLDGDKPSR